MVGGGGSGERGCDYIVIVTSLVQHRSMGSSQMEIPQGTRPWAPDAWDVLNQRLSLSGTLKRGRVSLGLGGEHDLLVREGRQ